jgi:putative nucleotidyltransferase with HDIG domain
MTERSETRERVLVVDDQAAVARTIVRWLAREGYDCRAAHSIDEAMALTGEHEFGIVLTDVHMPGGSGLDLARSLKSGDSSIQVIVVTGSTTLETAIEALRLDADDYLVKPFDPKKLVHAVNRAAEHRRLLLEVRDHRRTLEDRVREQASRLEKLYLSSIHSLVSALEAKDPHTRGHSDRVGEYAAALLEEVGGVDEESLRIGAQLHDIGKIGVRGGILRKPGPLDADEVLNMRQHPAIGVQILEPFLDDHTALGVVRHHHERWDGTGYPDGLVGEEIPLGARIVAIADTFDAMTTSRPYRAARTPDQALAEIRSEAGRQFDPQLADLASRAFLGPVRKVS